MKLFRRNSVAKAAAAMPPVPAPPKLREIALSDEQKNILATPVDPRVEHILQEIYADRAAAERALKARQVIEFPVPNSAQCRVVQDNDGFWRIIPGEPEKTISSVGAL